ncbi:cytochrome c [Leptothrix ochracea]|uniref:cytochrome c n=2 Tax=Leptothrix ochracea TaxID=735331 RepID=UPI0034E2DE63
MTISKTPHRAFFAAWQPLMGAGVLSVLLSSSCAVWSKEPEPQQLSPSPSPSPLALRGIMQALGQHMQTLAGAIAQEDWALVARTAPKVAEHQEPPALEKIRILSFIGTDISKFKAHDETTHHAAHSMIEAAERQDGAAVIRAFADLQTGCLGCHQAFRPAFKAHFYGPSPSPRQ